MRRSARGGTVQVTRAVLVVLGCLFLAGCSPVQRSAVRVNEDGTVDFASCVAVEEVFTASASTSSRTGPNGQIDESTETALLPATSVTSLDEGQVISFGRVPKVWDRLDIYIGGTPNGVSKPVERDRITVGDWYWDDDPSLFSAFTPEQRCDLKE